MPCRRSSASSATPCTDPKGHTVSLQTPGSNAGGFLLGHDACLQAGEIISPHPEERRFLAARLEGWPLAQQCVWPSFETAAQEGGLLRMRTFDFFTRSY